MTSGGREWRRQFWTWAFFIVGTAAVLAKSWSDDYVYLNADTWVFFRAPPLPGGGHFIILLSRRTTRPAATRGQRLRRSSVQRAPSSPALSETRTAEGSGVPAPSYTRSTPDSYPDTSGPTTLDGVYLPALGADLAALPAVVHKAPWEH